MVLKWSYSAAAGRRERRAFPAVTSGALGASRGQAIDVLAVGSLFTGCAGLDLGLEATGAYRIAWGCESDPACRRVLARRRPELFVHDDVRTIGTELPIGGLEPVDVLAGGFPCQDLSNAGRGAGLGGDRSGLWYAMADAVRLFRPRLVLVENVPGLASRGFGRVLYDLAAGGYVGQWLRLRASDVGAPHERERIFVFAVASDTGRDQLQRWAIGRGLPRAEASGATQGLQRQRGRDDAGDDRPAARRGRRPGRMEDDALADAGGERLDGPGGADANGSSGEGANGGPGASGHSSPLAWGVYEPAVRRWEQELGRAAPRPIDDRGRLDPVFSEWMLGFPHDWTEGVSRTARIRMLGNAVQVQVGELAGRMLLALDAEAW